MLTNLIIGSGVEVRVVIEIVLKGFCRGDSIVVKSGITGFITEFRRGIFNLLEVLTTICQDLVVIHGWTGGIMESLDRYYEYYARN